MAWLGLASLVYLRATRSFITSACFMRMWSMRMCHSHGSEASAYTEPIYLYNLARRLPTMAATHSETLTSVWPFVTVTLFPGRWRPGQSLLSGNLLFRIFPKIEIVFSSILQHTGTINNNSYPWHSAELSIVTLYAVKDIEKALAFFSLMCRWTLNAIPKNPVYLTLDCAPACLPTDCAATWPITDCAADLAEPFAFINILTMRWLM